MANYNIAQYAYVGKDTCLSKYPSDKDNFIGEVIPVNFLGSQVGHSSELTQISMKTPYQQIVLNGKYKNNGSEVAITESFESGVPYFLRLTLPRNENYDLNFALLLIPDPKGAGDLDTMNYQFIRYIHVPKSADSSIGQTMVICYEEPKFYTVNESTGEKNYSIGNATPDGWEYLDSDVKIAEAYPKDNFKANDDSCHNKFYYEYKENGVVFSYCQSGNLVTPPSKTQKGLTAPYGITGTLISHSWMSKDTEKNKAVYDIIFKPRDSVNEGGWSKLYLYLIPQVEDNDIAWLYEDQKTNTVTQFYGRHVDLKKVKVELYKMKNILGSGDKIVKRMGIWGRSELMFTINGEELKIGPSGYYEVQDFNISFLGVAALDNRDQYTVDVQYLNSVE